MVVDRLSALEKMHKEATTIEASMKTLKERQDLIDVTFKHEDAELVRTKRAFLDSMTAIQNQLKEVTMLQRAASG